MAINGTAVAVSAAGAVLLYSAVKNATISTTVRSFLAGDPLPSPNLLTSGVSGGSGTPGGIPGAPGGSGSDNYVRIINYLQQYFPKAGTAGLAGNMSVETGGSFSPTSYNAGEGAIGICQWELGRRKALQAYAKAHHSVETDLNMQLGYLMLELHTGFAHVYMELQAVRDPRTAAAIVDAQYEISSGDARQEREDRAAAIYQTLIGKVR